MLNFFKQCLDDPDVGVRDAAAETLGTLMRVVSERALAAHMDKVDKAKEAKVKEFFAKAEVKIGGAGGRPAPAAVAGLRASAGTRVRF